MIVTLHHQQRRGTARLAEVVSVDDAQLVRQQVPLLELHSGTKLYFQTPLVRRETSSAGTSTRQRQASCCHSHFGSAGSLAFMEVAAINRKK
jgi:hypothetical protein